MRRASLTPAEVRRLLLATVAGHDPEPVSKGELLAVVGWAKAGATGVLRRVLDGSLVITKMGDDGPEVASVGDWPEEQQEQYRAMLLQSDTAEMH